jgi:hypothetical protein
MLLRLVVRRMSRERWSGVRGLDSLILDPLGMGSEGVGD